MTCPDFPNTSDKKLPIPSTLFHIPTMYIWQQFIQQFIVYLTIYSFIYSWVITYRIHYLRIYVTFYCIYSVWAWRSAWGEEICCIGFSVRQTTLKVCSACGDTADYEQLQGEGAYARFVLSLGTNSTRFHGEITLYMKE